MSTQCQTQSRSFKAMIDMEADPCEDFYQFVCGRILNSTERPKDNILSISISEAKFQNTCKLQFVRR